MKANGIIGAALSAVLCTSSMSAKAADRVAAAVPETKFVTEAAANVGKGWNPLPEGAVDAYKSAYLPGLTTVARKPLQSIINPEDIVTKITRVPPLEGRPITLYFLTDAVHRKYKQLGALVLQDGDNFYYAQAALCHRTPAGDTAAVSLFVRDPGSTGDFLFRTMEYQLHDDQTRLLIGAMAGTLDNFSRGSTFLPRQEELGGDIMTVAKSSYIKEWTMDNEVAAQQKSVVSKPIFFMVAEN